MTAPPGLLERAAELTQLDQAIRALEGPRPRGQSVVVQAPAGFGKTSLLRAARAASAGGADWLWGSCEALVSAPPLGALVDFIDALPPELAQAIREGRGGPALAQGLLALLRQRQRPLVLVIDDLQWADSATQYLLGFLARRIEGTRSLLLLALRDDTALDDPVRSLLAGLPAQSSTRLSLPALSAAAVAQLALAAGRDPGGLHRATQGHPFFVTQLLAAPPGHLPLAVRDVVLARVAALPPAARELVGLISLSPRGLERSLLDALLPSCLPAATPADLDAALHTGWLEQDGPWLRFGHDIARQAVAEAVPPLQAAAWHQALFEGLGEQPAALLRRVHHARLAGLRTAVQTLAPMAAREATALGAHRQAKTLYEMALQGAQGLPVPVAELAAWHEAHAQACSAIYALDEADAAWRAALQAQRQAGQPLGVARAQRELGRMAWHRGAITEGMAWVHEALQTLQQADTAAAAHHDALAHERAVAQATMAQLHLMDEQPQRVAAWGEPALAVFEARGDSAQRLYTLNTLGAAQVLGGQADIGWQRLQRGLSLGLAQRDDGEVARAYTNLAGLALITHQHQRLHDWVAQGLDWCATRDQDMFAAALRVRLALGLMQQGRWAEARAQLQRLRAQPLPSPREDEVSALLLALLDLREARLPAPGAAPDPWPAIVAGTRRLTVAPWFLPAGVVRAEAAWLQGDTAQAGQLALAALPAALGVGELWRIGHIACWARRGTGRVPPGLPAGLPEPFGLELAGDAAGAGAAWQALGCPYEQALALLQGGAAEQRQAQGLLQGLGAAGAQARSRGATAPAATRPGVRGAPGLARHDPDGLTAREREVLALLRQRLGNAEIAARLGRSERTVEKHVAAILAKLGARSRHDLAP